MSRRQNMEVGKSRSIWWLRYGLGLMLGLAAGCAGTGPQLDQALLAEHASASRSDGVEASYTVVCPDVLEWNIHGASSGGTGVSPVFPSGTGVPPVSSGTGVPPVFISKQAIDPEGRINLDGFGRLRVEGRTIPEIAKRLAEIYGVSPDSVSVKVVEYRGQHLYLFGQVVGLQRAVAYRGPETVVDLLKHTGGITAGAQFDKVYVVRSRVAEGLQPEVFHIDLHAILIDRDQSTNLTLQPFDHVYVGETRGSSLEKCIPPILRPLYESCFGLRRPGNDGPTSSGERGTMVLRGPSL